MRGPSKDGGKGRVRYTEGEGWLGARGASGTDEERCEGSEGVGRVRRNAQAIVSLLMFSA